MSDTPTLVFLHGVRTEGHEEKWTEDLSSSLTSCGYPGLSGVEVIAPRYNHALRGSDDPLDLPPLTVKSPSGAEAATQRRDFEHRIAALEFRLARHDRGTRDVLAETVASAATALPVFRQARNYLRNPGIRAQVLNKILSEIPTSGRIVIVAHSLGSVIAADLIRRLPVELSVVGLVTIGSPLAEDNFDVDELRKKLEQPPGNLGWWVNFWSSADPVTVRRGVSSVIPWLLDLRIQTRRDIVRAHNASGYLTNPHVAEAVGYGLFGSLSRELVVAGSGVDIPLTEAQSTALHALRYAHLMKDLLKPETQRRFTGALRQVQAGVFRDFKILAEEERRALPGQILHLDFDFSDREEKAPVPLVDRTLSKDEAVVRLVTLADQNILLPFEIDVPEKVRKEAMKLLAAEMGLKTQLGADIFDSLEEAGKALPGARRINWLKWGALGAGLVAVVVATGGAALAVAPGLYGAAAVTSALATFGPGGMVGGLITAGTLVSASTGSAAVGIMSPATTPESVDALVKSQLAVVIMRQKHHLEPDHSIWTSLTETEQQLTREKERLDEFSDPKAASVVALEKKLSSVRAALKYLSDHRLDPYRLEDDPEEAGGVPRSWIPAPRMINR